jgi:transketolase
VAAGMRQAGLLPVTYTFAAFGTNEARASARLIDINCGHTRCAVLHDCTHTGISVGEDGETHQERHYLNIPFDHTQVWMPADSNQAGAAAEKAFELVAEGHTSVYVFSARIGHEQLLLENGEPVYGNDYVFDGKATILRGAGDSTDQLTILATGPTVHEALKAADVLSTAHSPLSTRLLNIASIRPLDATAIIQAALETVHLVVVEDHSSEGGLATQVADVIADFQLPCSLRRIGINHYFPSGPSKDLYTIAGLDAENIADAVLDEVHTEVCGGEDVLVSCLHAFSRNLRNSRFEASATPFVERLQSEKGYLEELREAWGKRECPKEDLPDNEQLRSSLSSA